MNKKRVVVATLCSIVLAFIIKGYCILKLIDTTTVTFMQHHTIQSAEQHCVAESFEKFLYSAAVLAAVIIAPFIFKNKSNI
jgi:hypothetical protein